jgi:hypothetical protein
MPAASFAIRAYHQSLSSWILAPASGLYRKCLNSNTIAAANNADHEKRRLNRAALLTIRYAINLMVSTITVSRISDETDSDQSSE